MNLKRGLMILFGLCILVTLLYYLPGIMIPKITMSRSSTSSANTIYNIMGRICNISRIGSQHWYNITIGPYNALIIALDTLNGTLPKLPIDHVLVIVRQRGRRMYDLFRKISQFNASEITPTGWSLFEAALSIAYLPYKCHSVILNPWPVDVKDRLNLTRIFINFTLCLPTKYFLHKLPYPPSGHVTSLSCSYDLVDSWTVCYTIDNKTICHTHYIYQLTITESAVVYNGLRPVTYLKVDDRRVSMSGHNPILTISYDIECVDSCSYDTDIISWIADSYRNPLGIFTRTWLLFKGELYFDGSKCTITGTYYHEPGWVFQGPAFTRKELKELVKEWTWLWMGVAIARKMRNITSTLLRGNWSRYWTYEYAWLTTLAICSLKPYMSRWEILNITNNALTTFLPTAIIHTKLWNGTNWTIILTALGKVTPRTFTMWHYINKTNYRIIIIDPLLYKTLCAGNSIRSYGKISVNMLKRLQFQVYGLRER